MDSDSAGSISPAITLALGFMAMLGVMVPPIVALFLRGGRSSQPEAPPIDLVAAQDEVNDHLVRELTQVRTERNRLVGEVAVLREENERLRRGHHEDPTR